MDSQQERRKKDIERLIAEDHLEEAIAQISGHLTAGSPEATCIPILMNKYRHIVDIQNMGTVAPDGIARKKSGLLESLQDLLHLLFPQTVSGIQTTDLASAIPAIKELANHYRTISEAFHYLEELLQHHFDLEDYYLNSLSLIRSSYRDFMIKKINGVIPPLDSDNAFYPILNDTLALIERLKAGNSSPHKISFRKKHSSPTFGELAIVSCDRTEITGKFLTRLKKKEDRKQPVMFFLLGEEKYGQCESLIHRLVTMLKDSRPGVHYTAFGEIEIPLVHLIYDFDEDDCLESLRSGFRSQKRLDKSMREINSLQDLMSNEPYATDLERFNYIPWAMKIKASKECWSKNGKSAIRLFLKEFCRLEDNFQARHVFFFIIRLKDEGTERRLNSGKSFWHRLIGRKPAPPTDLYQDLKSIAQAHDHWVTALPRLNRVSVEDLMEWYKKYFEVNNEDTCEKQVEEMIITKLREKEKEKRKGKKQKAISSPRHEWDMSEIEAQLRPLVEQHLNAIHGI